MKTDFYDSILYDKEGCDSNAVSLTLSLSLRNETKAQRYKMLMQTINMEQSKDTMEVKK